MSQNVDVSFGPGKNKRKWTEEEDQKLIESLLELVQAGTHKADNGFKSGYLGILERNLEQKLPGRGLKGKPLIESRIKTFKTHFAIIWDMLHGSTSGFGYDSNIKCVVAESHVWENYIQSHKDAAQFRYKQFPFYNEFCTIFGKDCATGNLAQGAAEIADEINLETSNENVITNDEIERNEIENEEPFLSRDGHENISYSNSRNKRRRSGADSMGKAIMDAAMLISSEIREATTQFSQALGGNAAQYRLKLNEEIKKIEVFDRKERHRACLKMDHDPEAIDVFFTLSDDDKEEFIREFMN